MTSCSNARENLCAYIDNELSIDERSSFEEHILSCRECKRELDEMLEIVGLCTDIPQQELPMDFKAELHEKLIAVAATQESNVRSIKKSKSFLFTKTFASIAAGMLLIFLAGSFYKFGLFSPMKTQDSTNSTAMAAEQPAAAKMEGNYDTDGAADEAENAKDSGQEARSFGIAAAADAMGSAVDRSATVQNREGALAEAEQKLSMEAASNKLSTITITADNPEEQVEKVKALALKNNGDIADNSAYPTGNITMSSTFTGQDIPIKANVAGGTDEALTQSTLDFVIPDTQYTQFITDLNAAFGEANVQKGAFVTEDVTELLNSSITRSNEIDSQIQELQKEDSTKNASEINELKTEKETVDSQIEKIRLGTDFVNVSVLINKK